MSEFPAVDDIKKAVVEGGPLVACWNVLTGWNLNQQVEWIKQGKRYFPTIYCPLLQQNANNPNKWIGFYEEYKDALKFINDNKLPVTLRWHNWLNDLDNTRLPDDRWQESPLIYRRLSDGSLDDVPIMDSLGPLEPWAKLGTDTGSTYWLQQLALVLPDVPQLYLLENNEAAIGELGMYTNVLTVKDQWGHKKRAWKPALDTISLRMAEWSLTNDANNCEKQIKLDFAEKYDVMKQHLFAALPSVWQGKVYTGGYAGLSLESWGANNLIWHYQRPQEDWPPIHYFDEHSERCYDDGSGSPFVWHDWVNSQMALQHNYAPLTRLLQDKELWHEDRSFWFSPGRCRQAALQGHGGYVLPDRLKGFARACLWAVKPKNKMLCFRWFASSQTLLTDKWYTNTSDPIEVQHLTEADFFNVVMDVVDEVWNNDILKMFWHEGEAVLNPDPHYRQWVLPPDLVEPPDVVDNRSRMLYTDADAPRYQSGKDIWRQQDGRFELKVFAQAYKMGEFYLVYAWSPRQLRTNVTVQVPGYGNVLFDKVDQTGEWRVLSTETKID